MAGIVEDNIGLVLAAVHADTEAKLKRAGDLVRDTMKAEVPDDSGDLKKSIRVRRDSKAMTVKIIAGNKKAYYVHMVLFGTKYKGENNFMQRSIDKNRAELKALFGESVRITR